MLPWRVFVVSLLLPAGTLCISSRSPLDLIAYPAYTVKLNPASPISNTTAEAILAGIASANGNHDHEVIKNDGLQIQLERHKKLDMLGLHDEESHNEHDQQLKGPSKPYLLRSSSNGQAYLCTVPQQSKSTSSSSSNQSAELVKGSNKIKQHKQQMHTPLTEAEKGQMKLKNEQDKKQAFERGLALLDPLKGSCLYLTQGWFTCMLTRFRHYRFHVAEAFLSITPTTDAFCYGSEIRQFHAVKNPSPNGPPLIEDLTQDAYTLGLWSNRLTQDEGLVDVKKARALGSLREILASEDKSQENSLEVVHGGKSASRTDEDHIGDERRYLVQRWTGGTLCDKTGVDRSIEVQVSLALAFSLLDHCSSLTGLILPPSLFHSSTAIPKPQTKSSSFARLQFANM